MAGLADFSLIDIASSVVLVLGSALTLYLMQTNLRKTEEHMPGVNSAFWLLGLSVFSFSLSSLSSLVLVEVYHNSSFPTVADLFGIVAYISFLIFLLRIMFPGHANMWLATLAGATLLSFQALLLQYILTVRNEVATSVILQFFYILLGFTFTVISIYVSHKYRRMAPSLLLVTIGVFSISQLAGNWFYSASVSSGGTALAQSKELGALLVRMASALSLGLGVPLAFAAMEGISFFDRKLLGSKRFQLALGVMVLVCYLLLSSLYFVSTIFPQGTVASPYGGVREAALRENLASAQGAFQIYLIFAILLGYSQSSLKIQEFQEQIMQMNKVLDKTVAERTRQLNVHLSELENFKELTVGRELKMIGLKRQLRACEREFHKIMRRGGGN